MQVAEDAKPGLPTTSLAIEGLYDHIQCLIDGLLCDLMAEQCAHAKAFIKSRVDVFSHSKYDIGRTRIILRRIENSDNTPHFEQLRCHPTMQLPLIDEHVQHMLQHDVIEPVASPWCSNVVMVRKQDGSMCFCVDYQKVNEHIKKDKFHVSICSTVVNTSAIATSIGVLANQDRRA